MKVIVRTETRLGSGTSTTAYIPREGCEYATEQAYNDALDRLFKADLEWLGELVTDSVLNYDGDSFIYGGDYSFHYEIVAADLA